MANSTANIPRSLVTQPWDEASNNPPPISCLFDEILAEIFVQNAYEPCEEYAEDFMIHRISVVYRRVFTLIGVCPTWRRVGLGCPRLWTIVPVIIRGDPDLPRTPPTELILQRAGSINLHLTISVDELTSEKLKSLSSHWHRFGVINLWSRSLYGREISEVLGKILEHSTSGSISKLSVRKQRPSFPSTLNIDTGPDPPIAEFVGSLSAFRIGRVPIKWTEIVFSHRLVELRLERMVADSDSEVRGFFAALSSARELKDLKVIGMSLNLRALNPDVPLEVVSLPKLEFLYIERGRLDAVDFILSHIAPGSYHLTLNLHAVSPQNSFDSDESEANMFYAFLKSVPVDKLILQGGGNSPRELKTHLRRTLESIPGLKTLVLNDYTVDPEVLMGLERPRPKSPMNNDTFASLTRLEFHNASLETSLIDLKPGLEAAFQSHRIQKMAFGARFGSSPGVDGTPVDENDEVVRWMRDSVPQFDLSSEPARMPEAWDHWRLWDI
ncbi:hypothetical protein RSOLAG22IIIB_09092 [Rhizoctonia solani]|uniref:F-box domain-containing protein n=1 Tax=Rhizoctonia solani TaxID=456999 RepID=A0A0K6FXN9_9AGAM|nr:hypothetical protein RSOLAG22IIIB_09092 [Rhizoctonia solani]